MAFKSGADWTGNSLGRPKGSKEFRAEPTKQFITDSFPDAMKIVKGIMDNALAGDESAKGMFMKYCFKYYLCLPKSEVEITQQSDGLVDSVMENIPKEEIESMKADLVNKMNEYNKEK